MTIKATYTDQLIVLVKPHIGARIKALAANTGRSNAEVIRECIEEALPEVERRLSRAAIEAQREAAAPSVVGAGKRRGRPARAASAERAA